jgi:hypothetical protein
MNVTAYDYMIESKHDTYGGFVKGKYGITDDISVNWFGEGALQSDASLKADKSDTATYREQPDIDAYYYRVILGAKAYGFFAKGMYEVMGHGRECGMGCNGVAGSEYTPAFSTPHATLHGHNGWADVMLGQAATGVNVNGLVDTSFTVGYSSKYLGKLMYVYHDFRTEQSNGNFASGNYGQEHDILYKLGITKRFTMLAKVALYDGDEGSDSVGNDGGGAMYERNISKAWLMFQYTYK